MTRIPAYLTVMLAMIVVSASAGVGLMTRPLSYGLVGWWPLNEGTGTNITDYSGIRVNASAIIPVPNGPSSFTFTAPSASYLDAAFASLAFSINESPGDATDFTALGDTITIDHANFPDMYDGVDIKYYDVNYEYLGDELFPFPFMTTASTNLAGFPGGISFTMNTTLTAVTNPWSITPKWTNGVVRSGYTTTANGSQYISLGSPTPIQVELNYPITIAGWCRRESILQYAVVFARRSGGSLQYQLTWVKSGEGVHDNKIRIDLGLGASIVSFNSTNAFTQTGYHHVAATYDGVNVCLYFDGVLNGKYPETRTIDQYGVETSIGSDNSGSISDASFDDVRIYNRALSSDEVRALYGGGYGAH